MKFVFVPSSRASKPSCVLWSQTESVWFGTALSCVRCELHGLWACVMCKTIICLLVLDCCFLFDTLTLYANAVSLPVNSERSGLGTCLWSFLDWAGTSDSSQSEKNKTKKDCEWTAILVLPSIYFLVSSISNFKWLRQASVKWPLNDPTS